MLTDPVDRTLPSVRLTADELLALIAELRALRESDAQWSVFAEELGKDREILEGQRDEARAERDGALAMLREALIVTEWAATPSLSAGVIYDAEVLASRLRAHLDKHQPKESP
jgi:hypothetical protein